MNGRSVSFSAGLRLGMLLTVLLTVMCLPANGAQVTITVKGTLNGMIDKYGIFGPRAGTPAGTPFTLVFTFDDTKGTPLATSSCGNYGSGHSGYGANSPGTAVMTVNGKSFEFGTHPDARSRIWRSVNTSCSESQIGMDVAEGKAPLMNAASIKIRPKGQKSLTQDRDWRNPVSLSNFDSRNGENLISIRKDYYGETMSYLTVDSMVVSTQKAAGPKTPAVIQVKAFAPPPIANPKGPDVSKIYVLSTDHGCRVTAYTPDGHKTTPEIALGRLDCSGIAVDDTGKIYISWLMGPFRVTTYDQDGKPSTPTIRGLNAQALFLDGRGKLFMLQTIDDANTAVVRSFTMDGIKTALDFARPLSLADGIAVDAAGKIYVVSQGDNVVRIFEADGRDSAVIKGLRTARGIAVAPDGRIYTANSANVMTHLPDGRRVDPTIILKDGLGTIQPPAAVAVDSKGRVYVGYGPGGIGIFNPDGKPASPAFGTPRQVQAIAIQ